MRWKEDLESEEKKNRSSQLTTIDDAREVGTTAMVRKENEEGKAEGRKILQSEQ